MTESTSSSRITILGSGTCVPSLKRNPCAFILETGHAKALFDCGPGTMKRLLEIGITIFDLTHLFLSHFHPDHTAELVPLLFATKYTGTRQRKSPLTLVAGKGFSHFFQGLKKVYKQWIHLEPALFPIVEMDNTKPDHIEFGDFAVSTLPVSHNPESIAYRVVDRHGKICVYSGDTDYCKALSTIAENADLFICESAHPDHLKVKGHLTPSLAGRAAQAANAKTLVLTHFYPECEQADVVKQSQMTYKGQSVAAEDLMVFEL